MDIQTLYKLPRMSNMELNQINSVEGLHMMVNQFFKPNFKIVEVGSFEGISTLLFSKFVDTIYSVDCYDYKVPKTGRIAEHDSMFKEAEKIFIARTKDIKNIVKIRKTSVEAAKDFPDRSLNAVYIDAEHDEESIREDIKVWRPKLKFGGLLCGHDFYFPYIQKILNEEGLLKITTAPDSSWCAPIPSISLVAVACTKVPETIEAIKKCVAQMEFNQIMLFTHENIQADGIEVIKIDKLDYKGYNEFVAMKLWQWIGTDCVLLVQNDGYITDASQWNNEFLKWDYIGALWPIPSDEDKVSYRTPKGNLVRVGNGGFSFRSRRLLRAPTVLGLEFTDNGTGFWHEDGFLCVHFGDVLKDAGIKFAPVELAAQFSTELTVPETVKSFGGHKYL